MTSKVSYSTPITTVVREKSSQKIPKQQSASTEVHLDAKSEQKASLKKSHLNKVMTTSNLEKKSQKSVPGRPNNLSQSKTMINSWINVRNTNRNLRGRKQKDQNIGVGIGLSLPILSSGIRILIMHIGYIKGSCLEERMLRVINGRHKCCSRDLMF